MKNYTKKISKKLAVELGKIYGKEIDQELEKRYDTKSVNYDRNFNKSRIVYSQLVEYIKGYILFEKNTYEYVDYISREDFDRLYKKVARTRKTFTFKNVEDQVQSLLYEEDILKSFNVYKGSKHYILKVITTDGQIKEQVCCFPKAELLNIKEI